MHGPKPNRLAAARRHARRAVSFTLALLALAGCATGVRLARRSDAALRAGDPQSAWSDAYRALQKDGSNPRVRTSARAAAAAYTADWQQRLRAIAASGDTLAAAEAARGFAGFRADAAKFGIATPFDPEFEREWLAWRRTAATRHYATGLAAERQGDAKRAWLELLDSDSYVPGFRDLATRLPRVWREAENRVVVLPFAAGLGGEQLAHDQAEDLHAYLDAHLDPARVTFTRLLPMSVVWNEVTVADLGALTREDALRLARRVGATRVVWGRLGAPATDTRVDHWHEPLWRPIETRDDSGATVVRWQAERFEAVRRERRLELDVATEILDVDAPDPLAHTRDTRSATVRSVWAHGSWPGEADAYRLTPPEGREHAHDDADAREHAWHDTFGDWSVHALLEQAHAGETTVDDRAWARAASGHPAFTQRLPDTAVLARLALQPEWDVVLGQLLALDHR